MNRRGFLTGTASTILAAPAIVSAVNIMNIRPLKLLSKEAMFFDASFTDYARKHLFAPGTQIHLAIASDKDDRFRPMNGEDNPFRVVGFDWDKLKYVADRGVYG